MHPPPASLSWKRPAMPEDATVAPKSLGPTMLAHLLHQAPPPKRPETRTTSYPTAALVLAAAKQRTKAQAKPAGKVPDHNWTSLPPLPCSLKEAGDRWCERSDPTIDSMTKQGIDTATATCLHRIHVAHPNQGPRHPPRHLGAKWSKLYAPRHYGNLAARQVFGQDPSPVNRDCQGPGPRSVKRQAGPLIG